MVLCNEVTGGEPQELGLVQMAVLVVFNILNCCTGLGEPGITDTASQLVVLAAVPFGIHQKSYTLLKAHVGVGGRILDLPFQLRSHGTESHGFQGFNGRTVLHLEPPPFRK